MHGNLPEERSVFLEQTAEGLLGVAMLGDVHPEGTELSGGDGAKGNFVGKIPTVIENTKHMRSSFAESWNWVE